ncbi:MAG: SpoIID/LytB domain-containing protein [Fusobacteriaceae bacterium]
MKERIKDWLKKYEYHFVGIFLLILIIYFFLPIKYTYVEKNSTKIFGSEEIPNFPVLGGMKPLSYLVKTSYLIGDTKDYTFDMPEEKVLEFFKDTKVQSIDSSSGLFRWKFSLSVSELTKILTSNMIDISQKNPNVIFSLENGKWVNKTITENPIGVLKKLSVPLRGSSTVVNSLLIEGSKGIYYLRDTDNIRLLFSGKNYNIVSAITGGKLFSGSTIMPSPFFAFERVSGKYYFYGGGYGHGVGLSQNGAQALAESGQTYEEILSLYFPKTVIAKTNYRDIRVAITNNQQKVIHDDVEFSSNGDLMFSADSGKLKFPTGTKIEIKVSGEKLQLIKDGNIVGESSNSVTISSTKLLTINSIDRKNIKNANPKYRGTIKISLSPDKKAMYVINHIAIEEYLRQVLPSEMNNSKGIEPLKAQAIAARTFAIFQIVSTGQNARYNITDTSNAQVYNSTSENILSTQAVRETTGMVLKYENKLAVVKYYSVSAGFGASAEEVW